jgi:hypothetical protein
METWEDFLNNVNSLLGQSGQGEGLWRFVVALAIVVVGQIVLLKSSEQNVRLRMVLEAAVWPIRLLLITLVVYMAKQFLYLPNG